VYSFSGRDEAVNNEVIRWKLMLVFRRRCVKGCRLVPGGGLEPPRAEARRILSPLRLPVPPSRLYLQVPDFTTCLWLCSPSIQNDECATV
jgi:hypothetical protein